MQQFYAYFGRAVVAMQHKLSVTGATSVFQTLSLFAAILLSATIVFAFLLAYRIEICLFVQKSTGIATFHIKLYEIGTKFVKMLERSATVYYNIPIIGGHNNDF